MSDGSEQQFDQQELGDRSEESEQLLQFEQNQMEDNSEMSEGQQQLMHGTPYMGSEDGHENIQASMSGGSVPVNADLQLNQMSEGQSDESPSQYDTGANLL